MQINRRLIGRVKKVMILILSLPKSAYFNFRYLKVSQAVKFPILLHWHSRVWGNGRIDLDKVRFGIIKLGFGDPDFPHQKFTSCNTGHVHFLGSAVISAGCELVIRGNLSVGDHFSCSGGSKIDAKSDSSFGNDVLIGHKCVFIDDDGHVIMIDGKQINEKKGYHIGNHVWFGRECLILKGTKTGDDIVFGARSTISGNIQNSNTIMVGSPVKAVKQNIEWQY